MSSRTGNSTDVEGATYIETFRRTIEATFAPMHETPPSPYTAAAARVGSAESAREAAYASAMDLHSLSASAPRRIAPSILAAAAIPSRAGTEISRSLAESRREALAHEIDLPSRSSFDESRVPEESAHGRRWREAQGRTARLARREAAERRRDAREGEAFVRRLMAGGFHLAAAGSRSTRMGRGGGSEASLEALMGGRPTPPSERELDRLMEASFSHSSSHRISRPAGPRPGLEYRPTLHTWEGFQEHFVESPRDSED